MLASMNNKYASLNKHYNSFETSIGSCLNKIELSYSNLFYPISFLQIAALNIGQYKLDFRVFSMQEAMASYRIPHCLQCKGALNNQCQKTIFDFEK